MIEVSTALLQQYSLPGPRYTSYPALPFWDTTPGPQQWLQHIDSALAAPGARAGLYVHLPFCSSLCTFCGCNVRVARGHGAVQPYIDQVLREFDLYREQLGRPRWTLGELQLGGGTPNFLDAAELHALLGGLLQHCDLAPDASLATEADPRTTTSAQLQTLHRYGFTRLSLGVQCLDPRVQDIINRVQTLAELRAVTDNARELGFTSLNYDLIYGLPLQTADSIEQTFAAVLRLRPERITYYGYTHVPWIRPSQRRFTEADLPEGQARLTLQQLGRKRLLEAGYIELGMDQFVLPGEALLQAQAAGVLQRQFMGYTPANTQALVGLGVSALGATGASYMQNEKNLQNYQTRVQQGELPLQRGHLLSAQDIALRAHIMALLTTYRTSWHSSDEACAVLQQALTRLAPLQADGLVELGERRIAVTVSGRAFLRTICMALDARLLARSPELVLGNSPL